MAADGGDGLPGNVPRSADGLTPEEALAELARRLYWNMDRLDPDIDSVEWTALTERERRFYGLLVKDLLVYGDLVALAMS